MQCLLFPGQGSLPKPNIWPNWTNSRIENSLDALDTYFNSDISTLVRGGLSNSPPSNLVGEYSLNQTQCNQVITFAIHASYKHLFSEETYTLGHSVGQFSSLYAHNHISFEQALDILWNRGKVIENAVIGFEYQSRAIIFRKNLDIQFLKTVVDIAESNSTPISLFNSPRQIVIVGSTENIKSCETDLNNFCPIFLRSIPLSMSYPFHTRFLRKAETDFQDFLCVNYPELSSKIINDPRIICNTTAQPINGSIGDFGTNHLVQPVLFTQSVDYLLTIEPNISFYECFPDDICKKFTQR